MAEVSEVSRSHRWAETLAGSAFPLVCSSCLVRSDSPAAEAPCDHLADLTACAAVSSVERLRCYSCGHEYAGDRNRLATVCPACGSDSFATTTTHPSASAGLARNEGERHE